MSIFTFVSEEKGQPIVLDGAGESLPWLSLLSDRRSVLGRGKLNWVNLSQLKKPGPLIRAHGSGRKLPSTLPYHHFVLLYLLYPNIYGVQECYSGDRGDDGAGSVIAVLAVTSLNFDTTGNKSPIHRRERPSLTTQSASWQSTRGPWVPARGPIITIHTRGVLQSTGLYDGHVRAQPLIVWVWMPHRHLG